MYHKAPCIQTDKQKTLYRMSQKGGQKDTVSKEVTRRRLSFHDFVLSFLKNHRAHLFCRGCFFEDGVVVKAPPVD